MSDFKPNLTKTPPLKAELDTATHDLDHRNDYDFDDEEEDDEEEEFSERILTDLLIRNMTAVMFFLMGLLGLYYHIDYAGWGIAVACLMML